jgi:hypothetical protein
MNRMKLALAGVLALGAAAIVPNSAEAQAAVIASPFHAGQWGIEAYAAGQAGGLIRFFTPRTALAFTLSGNHINTAADGSGPGSGSSKGTQLDATLGLRRHSMLAPRVAAIVGAGLVGGNVQQKQVYSGIPGASTYHSSYLGAYAEAGGQYMIADHFAVGVAYRLTGRHVKNTTNQKGSEFGAAVLPIRATLYF